MNDKVFSIVVKLIGSNQRDKRGKRAKTGIRGLMNKIKQNLRYHAAKANQHHKAKRSGE